MGKITFINLLLIGFIWVVCMSCTPTSKVNSQTLEEKKASESNFLSTMEKHLNAVSNKDLVALAETMSPEGKMQLILPSSEIMDGVDTFMNYHKEWFSMEGWTFETKILNTEIGSQIGMAITEIVYREADRNGQPYFNRMIVSYVLERTNGQWYIIKDHASSIEKSTDKK